ncbi:MAG: nitroreductase family protein [Salibacteraceae bacterium]
MINNKIPTTQNDVKSFIKNRWSPRAFADQSITQQSLNTLFEAASWAASSMNEQPWNYLYAHRGSEAYKKMVDCLADGNKTWAKNAAVLVITTSKKHFDRNDKPNRHAMHDLGAANTALLLQALSQDIYGHMMGGFDMEQTLDTFNINPETHEISCFMALGYLGSSDMLDEPLKERELKERSRKPLEAFTKELKK